MGVYDGNYMGFRSGRVLSVLAFAVLLSFPLPLTAQAQNAQGQAVQSRDGEEAGNPETQQGSQDEEDQEDLVLESLRDLPYLTIEDTLRYQRELIGVFTPVRPDTSLLFTSWEHALLREMKKQVVARPTSEGEAESSGREGDEPREKGIREISLGGIVFVKDGDWTVWLNGQRVTPEAIPPQIIDMRVKNSYIEIKWFDSYTNLVYPLRLRPHQRFNLDNRIFLPGAAPSNNG